MMDRRTLISAIALATVCARSGAFAQQQRSWRVGFVALPERPEPLEGSRFGAFALGMRELGYIERRNLTIEWRFAGGEVGRLAELAAEVVQRKVDVIVAGETPVISAAQKATATIPIVMAASNDPVGSGFVESLGRPGHNITGVSILSTDLSGKLVEMLQSVAPTATRVAILLKPAKLVQCRDRDQPAGRDAGRARDRPAGRSSDGGRHRASFRQDATSGCQRGGDRSRLIFRRAA